MTVARRGAVSPFPTEANEQVVTVKWDDSWGADGGAWEMRNEEIKLDMPCIATIGFLVAVNEHWIAVAQSVAEDQLGYTLRIPRGCIRSLTVVEMEIETPKHKKGGALSEDDDA